MCAHRLSATGPQEGPRHQEVDATLSYRIENAVPSQIPAVSRNAPSRGVTPLDSQGPANRGKAAPLARWYLSATHEEEATDAIVRYQKPA